MRIFFLYIFFTLPCYGVIDEIHHGIQALKDSQKELEVPQNTDELIDLIFPNFIFVDVLSYKTLDISNSKVDFTNERWQPFSGAGITILTKFWKSSGWTWGIIPSLMLSRQKYDGDKIDLFYINVPISFFLKFQFEKYFFISTTIGAGPTWIQNKQYDWEQSSVHGFVPSFKVSLVRNINQNFAILATYGANAIGNFRYSGEYFDIEEIQSLTFTVGYRVKLLDYF